MTDERKPFATAEEARAFLLGGAAIATIVSRKTGIRFTYKINLSDDGGSHFVNVLFGPDNTRNYKYLGRIANAARLWLGRKHPKAGDISPAAPCARAFHWLWEQLTRGTLPDTVEVYHEGMCGRCGRRLTVPESIASGFGPECIKHVGG
jgi:hypothetical protein